MNDNNNTNNMHVHSTGGLTRMTIAAVPAPAPQLGEVPYQSTKVGNAMVRLDMSVGGEISHGGVTKYIAGQDRPTHSVMATRQTVNGHDSVELIPGNPASRTLLKTALADGLIESAGPGLYRDRGAKEGAGSPPVAPAASPEDTPATDPGEGVFSASEDALWAQDIEPLEQFAYDGATANVTTAILRGADNLDQAARNLAEQGAMPMELAVAYVTEGQAMYERIVANQVALLGVTAEDKPFFYSWLRESKGRALHHAIQSLTTGRDVAPFRTLALEFKTQSTRVNRR